MQGLSRQLLHQGQGFGVGGRFLLLGPAETVDPISDDGIALVGQMNTYLMSASGG